MSNSVLSVIIRDDDVSALTRPATLETLYGSLWERGAPVCLAVVPVVSEHVPRVVGEGGSDGRPWDFLRRIAGAGRAEIALHGYRHAPGEWATSDRRTLERLLDDGLARLGDVLPGVPVRTFVPPHEHFSPVAREMLIERGFNVCTTSVNLWPPGRWGWLAYRLKQSLGWPGCHPVVRRGRAALFACDSYLFTPDVSPTTCLRRARSAAAFCARRGYPLIIVNHHWQFFDRDGQPRPGRLNAWGAFVAELAARDDVNFTTFSAYPRHPLDWPVSDE